MSRTSSWNPSVGLLLSTPVAIAACFFDSLDVLKLLCFADLGLTAWICYDALLVRKNNLLSPSLWAAVGYVGFGQYAIAYNLALDPDFYATYSSVPEMIRLVIIGWRVLFASVIVASLIRVEPKVVTFRSIPRTVAIALVITGILARILIRNNITGTAADIEMSWYTGLFFICLPVGLIFLLGEPGQRAQIGVKTSYSIYGVAILTALVDVSRKDTGSILVLVFVLAALNFDVRTSSVLPSQKLVAVTGAAVVCIYGLLMLTRAFSWATANDTDLSLEIETSLRERRANDTTNILTLMLDTVPTMYPFLNGLTLGSVVPVPRAIWPNRPAAHSYYAGLQYRGIPALEYTEAYMGDNQLSLSAHLLGEGYANFGYFGALSFEAIFGFLCGLLERLLTAGRLHSMRYCLPILLFFIATQQRGDLAMMNTNWLMCYAMISVVIIVSSLLFAKGRRFT